MAHRRDWLPNPLHAEDEHAGDPALTVERTDTVSRTMVLGRPGIVHGGHAGDLVLRPILLGVRPLDRNLGIRSRSRSLAAGAHTEIWRHESLLVLEEPADKDGWKHSWWVDPARDFVVRRHLLVHAADTMVEQTISYFRDSAQVWLPCRWMTIRRKNRPGLWISDQARLTAFRINGEDGVIPDERDRAACR